MKKLTKEYTSYFSSSNVNRKRRLFSLISTLFLVSCGRNSETEIDETDTTDASVVIDDITYSTLRAGQDLNGKIGSTDVITATSEAFTTSTSIKDEDPYDNDKLTVTAYDDILGTPTIDGIETISFTTSELTLGGDNEFDVILLNIAGANIIEFENSNVNSSVKTLDLYHVASPISVGSHFTNVKLTSVANTDITVTLSNDTTISSLGQSNNFIINAGSKNISLLSSEALGDLQINQANVVDIKSALTTTNISVVANGNVSIDDVSALKGNITIRSGGAIDFGNATNAIGALFLSNERAIDGSDIVITNANSFGSVSLYSVGSITATSNSGLASAKVISVTAREDSLINADSVSNQIITLSSENASGLITQFTLNASTLEQLNLGGSSPLVVVIDAADISGETVSNTNSDATL